MREVRQGKAAATPTSSGGDIAVGDFHAMTEAFQRALIETALRQANGNHSAAARLLGFSRHALRHQMQKLGMSQP
jgi:DNA-binding NtrC family response regulator